MGQYLDTLSLKNINVFSSVLPQVGSGGLSHLFSFDGHENNSSTGTVAPKRTRCGSVIPKWNGEWRRPKLSRN